VSSTRSPDQTFTKLEFSGQFFRNAVSSNIRLHVNPSSGSRVVPCAQT
jgi:hypothetical protein